MCEPKRKSTDIAGNDTNSSKKLKQEETKKQEYEEYDHTREKIWTWREDYKTIHVIYFAPNIKADKHYLYKSEEFSDLIGNKFCIAIANDQIYNSIYGVYIVCRNKFDINQNETVSISGNLTVFASKETAKFINCDYSFANCSIGFNDIFTTEQIKNNEVLIRAKISTNVTTTPPDSTNIKFNGLANLGMTCYMNSALQVLFSIKELRSLIFKIPVNKGDWLSKILNLQKLFYELQTKQDIVFPENLTKAFDIELGVQRDVHEFLITLLDIIESNIKKETVLYDEFKRLLIGELKTIIKCNKIDAPSTKNDPYMVISLDVSNCKNIYESMEKLLAKEALEGANSYETEKYGKQDAVKHTEIISFPEILMIHLKRFQYEQKSSKKLNDYYDISEDLDFNKYITDSNKYHYKLHAIIVHSGYSQSGHYFSLIKINNNWYEFNDKSVTYVRAESINDQKGGKITEYKVTAGNIKICETPSNSSAYILVYIREDKYKDIIPDEQPSYSECEEAIKFYKEIQLKSEGITSQLFIFMIGDEMIYDWKGLSLIPQDNSIFNNNAKYRLKSLMSRLVNINEFIDGEANKLAVPASAIGLWRVYNDSKSLIFDRINDMKKEVLQTLKYKQGNGCLYIRVIDPNKRIPVFIPTTDAEKQIEKYKSQSIIDYGKAFKQDSLIACVSNEVSEWKLNNKIDSQVPIESDNTDDKNSDGTEEIPSVEMLDNRILVFIKVIKEGIITSIKSEYINKSIKISTLSEFVLIEKDWVYYYYEREGKLEEVKPNSDFTGQNDGVIIIVHLMKNKSAEESNAKLASLYTAIKEAAK